MGFVPSLSVMVELEQKLTISWAATFRLLEVEAGKATYKEFIHSGLVSIVNSGKMRL